MPKNHRGPGTVAPGAMTALLRELAAAPDPADTEPMPLAPGTILGRYSLVRELGRGAFGIVYEASDPILGRNVAFKLVRPGQERGGASQLAREAEAIARLTHPNLVTLHGVGQSEHGPYLIFELLRGRTLHQRLGDGSLAMEEVVRVTTEIARGLAHAHGEGVVHRDLKPSNVFLCSQGEVKLLDFGMAHAFGRKRVSGGTPAYMAPEQWMDAPEDERTDVFALGVVTFRMLSGELPYPDDPDEWVDGSSPAPFLEIPAAPALGDLVSRMIEIGPVKRPRDGGQVLAALEQIGRDLEDNPAAGDRAIRTRRSPPRPPERTDTPRIAVLPFADLSPGKDHEYLAEGIAEEILDALACVEGLRVVGRTSSFSFKGNEAKLTEIGRELRVGSVLEGSVREVAGRVRIVARLVRTEDGVSLWSRTYEPELGDVLAIQDEIATGVVDALKVQLLGPRSPPAADGGTVSPEAYGQYLAGTQFLGRCTLDGNRRAVAAFENAIMLAPTHAPAHAGLADALVWLWRLSGAERFVGMGDIEARAREAARKAVELGPGLARCYLARARVRLADWDWTGAQLDVDQALKLHPGAPWGLRLKAALLNAAGRLPEAITATRESVELDPLDAIGWASLAWYQLATGDPEQARRAARRAVEISPEFDLAMAILALSFLLEGRPAEALATTQRCGEERFRLIGAALAEHDLGHPREAREALEALAGRFGAQQPYRVAEVHAWWGERDRALEWLERAFSHRDPALSDVREDPLLVKVRDDPRYAALLERMRLPSTRA